MRQRRFIGMMAMGLLLLTGLVATASEDQSALRDHSGGMVVVSPLIGSNRDELKLPARGPGMPATTLTDDALEYGLYAMYVHPRIVVNNFFFYTEPNDAEVAGNLTFVNLYGSPEHNIKWNVGAGYLWHEIKTAGPTIKVNAPMVKVGGVFRCPKLHLSLNPYVGYLWEGIEVGSYESDTESMLYGVTLNWHWRMLMATCKYYMQDDQDTDEQYNVVRARLAVFANDTVGLLMRAEYMEHSTSDDTSFLIGPVVVF
ncbi:MAG: hypothetical protein HQ523_07755 [Lentisphaerae bacterium]|nr:hypothetical protein [Lentisphaerota bacterium]